MIMLKIYHYTNDGFRNPCGETKNPLKWLKKNNKKRYKDVVWCKESGEKAHKQKKCSCIELINEFSFEWKPDKNVKT